MVYFCQRKVAEIQEERIEFVCDRENAKEILAAIRKVHPYDEIAADVFRLLQMKNSNPLSTLDRGY